MSNGSEQPPDTTSGNPFSLLAYVLFRVRHSLEDREEAERPPRWVRIARGAEFKEEALGSIVSGAVNGMGETLSYMVELTLDLEELLYQTDAAKAIAEVMLRLIQASTDENFQNGIETLVGADSLGNLGTVMDTINSASSQVEDYLDYIPDPEDVRGMGHELYRLLCIVQRDFPRNPADNTIDASDVDLRGSEHLIQQDSGKVRLMAWAYEHGVTSHGLGPEEGNEKELFRFASRRLYQTAGNADLPQITNMEWQGGDDTVDIYEFNYDAGDPDVEGNEDIVELVQLLKAHDYNTPSMTEAETTLTGEIRANLMKFQAINELPITGEVDNDTINRLMNLDFARKNLRRAKPYDANFDWPWPGTTNDPVPAAPVSGSLQLINPGADHWEDEGLDVVPRAPHPYYVIPITPRGQQPADAAKWPKGQGWITDASVHSAGYRTAFVALHSRTRNVDEQGQAGRFIGGKYSEGEAVNGTGRYFWAARHTEPWRDARTGTPGSDALFDGSQPPSPGSSLSRMYQWIALPDWLKENTAVKPDNVSTWELKIYATVQQRSLFQDRGGVTKLPDQGRIYLELYAADGYTDGTVTVRNASLAKAADSTALFPDHATTASALDPSVDEVDRKRLWTLRQTDKLTVTGDIVAVCLVAEGVYQSAYDIDAYFDDFCVRYQWVRIPA